MIITLVTDQFYQNNHGTSVSAQRFYNGLVDRGHIVRVLSIDAENNTAFALKERYFGKRINKIINSQGFQFAKPDRQTIINAVVGSDIVHIYMPFKLGYKTLDICRELNIPCTAGFHIVPENITSSLYLENSKVLNKALWEYFKHSTYRYIENIHCPSVMVANQVKQHKYNSNLHIVSNGYNADFRVVESESKPTVFKDKFVITFIGRFSREKRHDLIVKAVAKSKYKDKIQIIFGGKGPTKKRIMKLSKKIPNYPMFGFFTREQLISIHNFADLYIHPADIEVEGMSCIEAIACGCVPLVSNSTKSATPQFTTHPQSLFKAGNADSLSKQIDWWIENEQERIKHKKEIAIHANKFSIESSMDYYISMFENAINNWDYNFDAKAKKQTATIIDYYKKAN